VGLRVATEEPASGTDPRHDPSVIDRVYRESSAKVLATLIRLLGDLDRAEDALQEAFGQAQERWPTQGVPDNPVSWLISVGRFRAIDQLRRAQKVAGGLEADLHPSPVPDFTKAADEHVADDTLRLVFLCCHPRLSREARVALTLREVCGMTTESIAAAFLVSVPTVAQRLVRAKATLRRLGHLGELPRDLEPSRWDAVLGVIYLVFNEGYFASEGPLLVRRDLVDEALRLGRLVLELSHHPEALGLVGLMLIQKGRLASRTKDGALVLLEDQDRSLWDQALVQEGAALAHTALRSGHLGPYTLQAAIAAVHATAPSVALTDWSLVVDLYEHLVHGFPSPVFELNLAIAVSMREGPAAALGRIEPLFEPGGALERYAPGRVARGELARRAGLLALAKNEWERALDLTTHQALRWEIGRRLASLN